MPGSPARIALDAMGGDDGPRPACEGAVDALSRFPGVEVILVGKEQQLRRILAKSRADGHPRLRIVEAPDTITMHDHPRESLRKTKSSLAVAVDLVKRGEADAAVSAGNTGAVLAHCQLAWRNIPPIRKPGIASLLPSYTGRTVLVDSGAAVDCKPQHLVHFAIMGSAYAQLILNRDRPRVGVMSIGEEETKGNELSLETCRLLKASPLNFVGNAEGRDVFSGKFDVIVCDGFVGNVVLKTAEGAAKFVAESLRKEAMKRWDTKIGGLLFRPAVAAVRRRTDYDETGGAPLLGVNGISIIAHGRSNARAYMNALRVAKEAVERQLLKRLREDLDRMATEPKAGASDAS